MDPIRILLVDDDTRLAKMVATYLRGHGFEVTTRDRRSEAASRRCGPAGSRPCCST